MSFTWTAAKKVPPHCKAALRFEVCLLLAVLAGLVSHTAAGLAGGLARGLALTTAASGHTLAEVTGLDGLDSIHSPSLQSFRSVLCRAQYFLYTD